MDTATPTYTPWTELRTRRINAGHSISSLARAVPMSQSQLCQVEQGKRGISDVRLAKLAAVLGVEPAALDRSRPHVPPRQSKAVA